VVDLGSVQVSQPDMIAFASKYDPQPMHLDPNAASFTIYGGLIASGWHTGALFMGLLVRSLIAQTTSLGSPGMEDLRWPAPVRVPTRRLLAGRVMGPAPGCRGAGPRSRNRAGGSRDRRREGSGRRG